MWEQQFRLYLVLVVTKERSDAEEVSGCGLRKPVKPVRRSNCWLMLTHERALRAFVRNTRRRSSIELTPQIDVDAILVAMTEIQNEDITYIDG
jgi:hypothetical protein